MSPVPGYHAPCDQTVGPGTRVVGALFGVVADDAVVAKCFVLWASLVGAINLEVFGQYGLDTLTDPAVAFDAQVALLTDFLAAK